MFKCRDAAFRTSLSLALIALTCPLQAFADDAPAYSDAVAVRAELVQVLTCEADHATFMRLGEELSNLYFGNEVAPALAGWKLVGDGGFVVELAMPEPVQVYGRTTSTVIMAGQGLLAVLDGDLVESLADELEVTASDDPWTGHIRTRVVRSNALGDGIVQKTVQTVSAITTHPGKTMAGCEYQTTGY